MSEERNTPPPLSGEGSVGMPAGDMPSLTERVARAIAECSADKNWGYYTVQARAAIEAMREPTEAMRNAGGTCKPFLAEWSPGEIIAASCFRAMIDAALKEGE